MKFNLLFIVIYCTTFNLSAQPTIQWQKTLGGSDYEEGGDIRQTADGGYVMVGATYSHDGDVTNFHGLTDFWVVKTNPVGTIEWQKALGGSDFDWPYAIRQTIDNGYIVVGVTESNDGNVVGNHGNKDAWIVKLDKTGEIEWQKSLGGSGWDEAWSVELTPDGGYIIGGMSNSTDGDASGNPGGSLDLWIVKLASNGSIEWQKSLGGSEKDQALSIKPTSDGGFIATGLTKSDDGDIAENNGDVDFWVLKLGSSGEIEWQNTLGGAGLDVGSDILEVSDGFIACGYTGSHNTGDVTGHKGLFDVWVVKLTKNGTLLWQKTMGGNNGDWGRKIIELNDGMFLVVGTTKSVDGDVVGNNGTQVAWIVKIDKSGLIIWQKTLGGTQGEGAYSIQQSNDNGFIVGCYAWSNDGDVSGGHGKSDLWVVKLSPESVGIPTIPAAAQPDIFPNPAGEYFSLQTTGGESSLEVKLLDMLGREVGTQTISNGGNVTISTLPKGLYLIQAVGDSGKRYTGKIRKE